MPRTVAFSETFTVDTKAYSLIELPAEILEKIESNPGTILRFVGSEEQEAVMITEDKTYAVRRGETSNTQLLLPCSVSDLLDDDNEDIGTGMGENSKASLMTATANVQTHLEISATAPRLKPLPGLLNRRPYEGPDYEDEDYEENKRRLTREELRRMLQASPKEIEVELQRIGALDVDGYLCLLGNRYESNLMCSFFAAATLNGWDLSSVSMDDVQKDKDMGNFPDFILKNFLSKYDKVPEEGDDAAMRLPEGHVCLDIHRMALFRADELLRALPTSSRLTVEDFLKGWGSMLPPMKLNMDMLLGRAVTEQRGTQLLVKSFDVNTLSTDIKGRFKQIFLQKPSWRREEILPYIIDLNGKPDALLLKHTRVTRVPVPGGKPEDETKMYSSRQ